MESNGVWLIGQERVRQLTEEGYNAAHDDAHTKGEIAVCAAMLAAYDTECQVESRGEAIRDTWMAELVHKYSRKTPVERLIVAGAMIAAEIDRLERKKGIRA